MPSQGWQQVLVSQQVDGTALTNSVTEAVIIPGQAVYTLPANFLATAGQALRLRAMGRISNVVTTPGTLTFRIRFGGTGITGIIVATSGAMNLNIVAKTNVTWILDWDLVTRTVGSSTTATFMHSGQWQSESNVGSAATGAGGAGSAIFPTSAPAVGTGFDSTIANQIYLTANFSVSTATTSIQSHSYKLESIN